MASLYNPGCPGTHSVHSWPQIHGDLPTFASQVLPFSVKFTDTDTCKGKPSEDTGKGWLSTSRGKKSQKKTTLSTP